MVRAVFLLGLEFAAGFVFGNNATLLLPNANASMVVPSDNATMPSDDNATAVFVGETPPEVGAQLDQVLPQILGAQLDQMLPEIPVGAEVDLILPQIPVEVDLILPQVPVGSLTLPQVSIVPQICTACGAFCSQRGICNENLECVARRLPYPVCTKQPSTTCPPLACPLLCLSPAALTTENGTDGCPVCRCIEHSRPKPCASNDECKYGFCWDSKCVKYVGIDGACDGATSVPRRCEPGLQCKITSSVGGTCVQLRPVCPPCPKLLCPIDQQVSAEANIAAETNVLAHNATELRPRCPSCPCCPGGCLPCCSTEGQKGQTACRSCTVA